MTPEEQMKAIVEAAGECWHENKPGKFYCVCGEETLKGPCFRLPNPSPTDLNVLMEYAEKLKVVASVVCDPRTDSSARIFQTTHCTQLSNAHADTPAYALREALYQAVKGEG